MYDIRSITSEDSELFRHRLSLGFGMDPAGDEQEKERFGAIFDFDRTLAVFDGDDMIGTGAAISLGITVPGGAEVPMGGTSLVTVQPTHRRRGVLRALMDRHLEDVANHGEPLAGLWASESSIYGRFGYGPATFRQVSTLDTRHARFRTEPDKGVVRLVETEEAGPLMRSVYERAMPERVGMLARTRNWWQYRLLADPESRRGGMSARRHVVFSEGGEATGYATYRQKQDWGDFVAAGRVEVAELVAATDTAHTGIWHYLTNIDLFPKLEYWNTPIDDPLPAKVTDPRRVARKLVDALWVRLMDLPAALAARRYESDGVITVDVADPTRPESAGTYRLEVADGEGSCERVTATADLTLDIDVLGHLFLGGGDAMAMAAAGRIEGHPTVVLRLHRMFRTDRAPWCPEIF